MNFILMPPQQNNPYSPSPSHKGFEFPAGREGGGGFCQINWNFHKGGGVLENG